MYEGRAPAVSAPRVVLSRLHSRGEGAVTSAAEERTQHTRAGQSLRRAHARRILQAVRVSQNPLRDIQQARM